MNGYLGSLEAVIYFRNHRDPHHPPGHLMLSPYSDFPTPSGYTREAARTLGEIDKLQFTLIEQERRECEEEILHDEAILGRKQREVTDRLRQRMVSGATTPYERDFIEAYLQLQEQKRDKHRQRFMERTMYLHARENDTPKNRRTNDERVSLDRVNF
jgi:hypothetical protein